MLARTDFFIQTYHVSSGGCLPRRKQRISFPCIYLCNKFILYGGNVLQYFALNVLHVFAYKAASSKGEYLRESIKFMNYTY